MATRLDPTGTLRSMLLDTVHCPSCGALLTGPGCGACGVDLSGPVAAHLLVLSRQAAALLGQRQELLERLRTAPRGAAPAVTVLPRTAVPGPALLRTALPGTALPPRPAAAPTPAPPLLPALLPAPAARPSLLARVGVQGVLVGLGALLVAVAALVFLVFTWDRLPLGGRAGVVAGVTVAALAGSAWLRSRLAETAEAIGAIAVVLLLGDAWAVPATGLLGADRMDGIGYATVALGVCALVTLGWGAAARMRAGSVTAALLAPLVPVLAGLWAAPAATPEGVRATALGLLGGAAVTSVRRVAPQAWALEHGVLRLLGAVLTALAGGAAVLLVGAPGSCAVVLAGITVVAVGQVAAERLSRARPLVAARVRTGWGAVAGASAALSGVAALQALRAEVGIPSAWLLAGAPAAAGCVAAALALGHHRGSASRPVRPVLRAALRAARGVTATSAVPAAVVVAGMVAGAAAQALAPWHLRATDPVFGAFVAAGTRMHAAAVLGLLGAALPIAVPRPGRWAPVAASALGLAALAGPLQPRLAVAGVVPLYALVAVGSAAAVVRLARLQNRLARRTGLCVASAAGTVAVLLAWSVRELSVPATLVGVAGLVLARRVVPERARVALAGGALAALAVAAGGVAALAGAALADRVVVAGATAALLAAVPAASTRPRRLAASRPERLGAVLTGLAVTAGATVWVTAATADARELAGRLAVLLGGLLVAAAGAAARRPGAAGSLGGAASAAGAGALAVLVPAVAAAVAVALAPLDEARLAAALAAGGALVAVGALAALAGIRAADDARRVPAEAGAALAGVAVLIAGTVAVAGTGRIWVLWTLLGAAASVAAVPVDRRRTAWAGWVLLTAAGWLRLDAADVDVVEAYTVPPALVLLAVAALRLRRERRRAAARALLPGLSLALLPSILATATGTPWRPVALLAGGTAALLVAATGFGGRRFAGVLAAAGAATAGGAATVRSLAGVAAVADAGSPAGWRQVEAWAAPGAVALALAAVVVVTRLPHRVERLRGTAAVPAFGLAVVPSLVAALGGPVDGTQVAVARSAAVLAAACLVALAAAARPDRHLLSAQLAGTAVVVAALAARTGYGTDAGVLEAWSAPVAGLLCALGAVVLRRRSGVGSWLALGPGVALLLGPTVVLAAQGGAAWRVLALPVVAAGVVLTGAKARQQAPVVLGGIVLAAHAVVQLGPEVASSVAALPRWSVLAVVGAVLLAAGATYERRLRELRAVRLRLSALR